MNTITPLMRAILDALDTMNDGAQFVEILRTQSTTPWREVFDDVTRLLALGLVEANDSAYTLTDAGCDALWALQKAEQMPVYVHPVAFMTRSSLVDFLRSSRL